MTVRPLSLADLLPVGIASGFLLIISASVIMSPHIGEHIEWEGGALLYGPLVWTAIAATIIATYAFDRRGSTSEYYGQAFSAAFLALVILNVSIAICALATLVLRTSVPSWFHDKILFAFPFFCAVHLGMGAVFRPHMTSRPLGLLAWTATIAEGIALVPVGGFLILVLLVISGYGTT
ncbi:MAG: hypothetical protein MUE55_08305 [Thermoplasmata archaeon]|jgi:hypothetical protein|nr:hypothetical protein [Thermoplasmata archaeon]